MPHVLSSVSKRASPSKPEADDAETPVPFPDNENDISIELAGRNLVKEHLFSGWGNIWKGPNSKLYAKDAEKQIKKLDIEQLLEKVGNEYTWDAARCLLVQKTTNEPTFTIAELAKHTLTVDRPISVHVLEKRCVTITAKGFLLSKFIVADPTGCCCLVFFGDSSIYPAVNVGDILVLSSFKVQKLKYTPDPSEATTIKSDKMFEIEFKLLAYDFKREYLLQGLNKARWFRDFYKEEGLKLAHHLWNSEIHQFEFVGDPDQEALAAFDLGGVVVYVSPLMRSKKRPSDSRFFCYRWLQLISSTKQEKPLSVKLFCNNQNWDRQADIVPGTLLVLTNVTMADSNHNCYENYFETAWYTRVLVNSDVKNVYLAFRPESYRTVLRLVAAVKACKQILAHETMHWTAGGFPNLSIRSDNSLAVKYANEPYRPCFANLVRREATRLVILGYVYAVQSVSIADNNDVVMESFWRSSNPPNFEWYEEVVKASPATAKINGVDEENEYNQNRSGKKVFTFFPDLSKYAFAYQRNVGPPKQVTDMNEKLFATYDENLNHYKDVCKQLLMPSVREVGKIFTDYPLLRPAYFLMHIADPQRKQLISAMYSSAPFEVMESNLLSLIGRMEQHAGHSSNGASNGRDQQSEGEEAPMDVDTEEQDSGKQDNTELTAEDKEKNRADTVFALDILQLESLGENPKQNLVVNLTDFTPFLDDVTPNDSASQQATLTPVSGENSHENVLSESQQQALSQIQEEDIFATQSFSMQQD